MEPEVASSWARWNQCTPSYHGGIETLYWSMSNNCASLNRRHRRPLTTKGGKVRREEAEVLPFPVPEPWAGHIRLNGCANVFSTLWVSNCSLRTRLQGMGFDSRSGKRFLLYSVQIGPWAHLAAYPMGTKRLFTPGPRDDLHLVTKLRIRGAICPLSHTSS
jgi:hypothetical protein